MAPDFEVDQECLRCSFRFNDGRFVPHGAFSKDHLDEKAEFERRDQSNAAYFELLQREMDADHSLRTNLDQAIHADDLSLTLRVVASDLSRWGANSYEHLRHHVFCKAKDPKFVDKAFLPEVAPYRYFVPWVVRDIIGSQEAVDRLDLRKLPEYARRIKDRFDALNEARRQFANDVTELTLRTRGEDRNGTIAVFHAWGHLSQRAITLVRYLEGPAKQFEVVAPESEALHEIPIPEPAVAPHIALVARPFTGGTIVFEQNRVLLCDVNICSDSKSAARRIVLDLALRQMKCAAYSLRCDCDSS